MAPLRLSKILAPIAILLVVIVGALWLVKKNLAPRAKTDASGAVIPAMVLGAITPDFTFKRFPSGEVKLSELNTAPGGKSKVSPKVLLINFWATWCDACIVEMPSIIQLRERLKDKGFEVALVSVDENPQAVLPRMLEKLKVPFPTYIDEGQKLSDLFDVHAIPMTVILDSSRKILFTESGERDWASQSIVNQMEEWLKK